VVPFLYPAGSFAALLTAFTTVPMVVTLTGHVKHLMQNNLNIVLFLNNKNYLKKQLDAIKNEIYNFLGARSP
jgi:hypothetical protein